MGLRFILERAIEIRVTAYDNDDAASAAASAAAAAGDASATADAASDATHGRRRLRRLRCRRRRRRRHLLSASSAVSSAAADATADATRNVVAALGSAGAVAPEPAGAVVDVAIRGCHACVWTYALCVGSPTGIEEREAFAFAFRCAEFDIAQFVGARDRAGQSIACEGQLRRRTQEGGRTRDNLGSMGCHNSYKITF